MIDASADREGFAAFLLRLRASGITPKNLIAAFESLPRRAFLATQYAPVAWTERMLPIDCGEAIEGVDLQAMAIAQLAIEPGHRVLEIGTGTGYTAAVISRLAGRVLSVERWRRLAEAARRRLETFEISNVHVQHSDGSVGAAFGEGPFDRIVVWSAFETMPRAFVDQLATHGVMVLPIGPSDGPQMLTRLSKVGSRFDRVDLCSVRLQPILKGVAAVL